MAFLDRNKDPATRIAYLPARDEFGVYSRAVFG